MSLYYDGRYAASEPYSDTGCDDDKYGADFCKVGMPSPWLPALQQTPGGLQQGSTGGVASHEREAPTVYDQKLKACASYGA